MAEQKLSLEIRLIEPGDRLTGLSLGEGFTALKTFLQRHAIVYHEKSLARTYGVFDKGKKNKIVAYITLVCGEIVVGENDKDILQDSEIYYKYPHYPSIKIARLAVDTRYRKNDIGKTLVNLALGTAKDVICPAVGCRFVIVDSKKSAVKFYEKVGFTILDTEVNRAREEPVLFIDLHKTPAT